MEVLNKEKILELIKLNSEKLEEIKSKVHQIQNLAFIDLEIGNALIEFEGISGELIEDLQDSIRESEYICGCGSNLKIDRENTDEEPACGKCAPTQEEWREQYE